MSRPLFGRKFQKQYAKLNVKIQRQADERIAALLYGDIETHHRLHRLVGEYEGYWSINVTGDYRIIFFWQGDIVAFEAIGTHSQLYG